MTSICWYRIFFVTFVLKFFNSHNLYKYPNLPEFAYISGSVAIVEDGTLIGSDGGTQQLDGNVGEAIFLELEVSISKRGRDR